MRGELYTRVILFTESGLCGEIFGEIVSFIRGGGMRRRFNGLARFFFLHQSLMGISSIVWL